MIERTLDQREAALRGIHERLTRATRVARRANRAYIQQLAVASDELDALAPASTPAQPLTGAQHAAREDH